jgi:hypothetical protein
MRGKSLTVMQDEVSEGIEIGMNVDDAEKAMNAIGFRCNVKTNSTLSYRATQDAITTTKRENVNYMNCIAERQNGLVSEHLKVALVFGDDKLVKEIVYVPSFTGP